MNKEHTICKDCQLESGGMIKINSNLSTKSRPGLYCDIHKAWFDIKNNIIAVDGKIVNGTGVE